MRFRNKTSSSLHRQNRVGWRRQVAHARHAGHDGGLSPSVQMRILAEAAAL
jgi:hypothetical protein